ncbi:MAG: peptidase M14 [Flavobacterium sp.]|nr:peptidase M14 [Flavobacterium sp.]
MNIEQIIEEYKVESLSGRYVTLDTIEPILMQWNTNQQLKIEGYSVLEKPIYSFTIGTGKTKILLWSQMHGNESTTTKALLDLLLFLNGGTEDAQKLMGHFTLLCFPMLNPDGAKAYTRENANGIDLNRDAQNRSQPESQILRKAFDSFQPDYCYNLHDQRTIYGAGSTGKPATVSFLAPSYNEECAYNATRTKAVDVIVAMNSTLQKLIPNQVGRFDDAFNLNCVGDTFQSLGVPTILFEAGHFPGDYQREQTRKFVFLALLSGLRHIYENVIVNNEIEDYLRIPQNKVVFYDIVYKNVKINYDGIVKSTNFAIQFKEELFDNQISFTAYFSEIGNLESYFGHVEYDAKDAEYSDGKDDIPKLNTKADFCLGKNTKIVNGMPLN